MAGVRDIHLQSPRQRLYQLGPALQTEALKADIPVLSSARGHYVCLTQGGSIYLFNERCVQVPNSHQIEHTVSCIGWSHDGYYLALGDHGGSLHIIIPSLNVFHTQTLFPSNETPVASPTNQLSQSLTHCPTLRAIQFSQTSSKEYVELFMLADRNILYFAKLPLGSCQIDALQGDKMLNHLREAAAVRQLDLPSLDIKGALAAMVTAGSLLVLADSSDLQLSVYEQTSNGTYMLTDMVTTPLLQGTGISRCDVSADGTYIVVLTNECALGLLAIPSLVLAGIWWECVEDFVLCETNGDGSVCFISEDRDQQRCVILASLPRLEVVYSCPISTSVMLCCGHPLEDCIFVFDEAEGNLQLKQLIQALPEDRLASLLAQHKFEEALSFAAKFNLDCQLVHKAQATVLNGILCTAHWDEVDHTPLLRCLENVGDVQFIVQLVLTSTYPTAATSNTLLQFAVDRSQGQPEFDALTTELFCVQRKLVTYNLIAMGKFSPQAWLEFLHMSMVEMMKHHLQLGQLRQAGVIWTRHRPSLIAELDGDTTLSLLDVIPDSTPSSLLGQWLSLHYLQVVFDQASRTLGPFLDWVDKRIRLMELLEQDVWPSNALMFVAEVESGIKHLQDTPKTFDASVCPLARLLHLKDTVEDLCLLHVDLQCPVSLSIYKKSTREQILFSLLDGIMSAELVPTSIQTLVVPYARKHSIPVDHTLLQYLKVFLPQTPQNLSDSPWEAKAVVIIQSIGQLEFRVMGCVELLRFIRPPWSQLVEDLVQQCLKIVHPSTQSLREQYKLLQLNKKLLDYEIHDFNFGDICKGEKYIRRILSRGGTPKALEDALMVADMYHLEPSEVYMYYVTNLVHQKKEDEACQLLQSLERELCKTSAVKIYSWSFHRIQFPSLVKQVDRDDYMASVKTAIVSLKALAHLEGVEEIGISYHKELKLFQRLLKLAQQFHLCLSCDTLRGDHTTLFAIFKHVVEVYHKSPDLGEEMCALPGDQPCVMCALPGDQPCVIPSTYYQMLMFTQLIGFQETDLLCILTSLLIEGKQLLKISSLLSECSLNIPSAQTIVYLLVSIWRALDESAVTLEIIQMMSSLASLAVINADSDELADCVEAFQLCAFLADVYHRCDVITLDSADVKSSTAFSTLGHWLYPLHFNGDTLPLTMKSTLLPALNYALTRFPSAPTQDLLIPRKPFTFSQLGFTAGSRENVHSLLELAGQCCHTLKTGGCLLTALRCMLQTLMVYNQSCSLGKMAASQSVLDPADALIGGILAGLFNAILSCSHLDPELGLCLLLQFAPLQSVEVLKNARQLISVSYSKVISLCQLAINYGKLTRQPGLVETSSSFLCSAQWGKTLGKLGIPFTEAFRGTLLDKRKVIPSLLRNCKVDQVTIQQYCLDFQIHYQQTLLSYLKVLLTEYQDGYLGKVEQVTKLLEDKQAIGDLLTTLTKTKIGLYDYERLTVILKSAATLGVDTPLLPQEGLLLLRYLEAYTRRSEPTQQEMQLYQLILQKPLPREAYQRLPFHLLLYKKSMEVISAELAVDNVDQLVPIVQILGLSGDEFLLHAITVVAGKGLGTVPLPFKSFAPLIAKFHDNNMSLKAAVWLSEHFTAGEDHVAALKSAVDFGKQCLEQSPQEEGLVATLEKMQKTLVMTETHNILCAHGLTTDSYSDLCCEPQLLIEELYKDAPFHTPSFSAHTICEEIVKLNSLNLHEIKEKLVELWLPVGSKSREMDLSQTSFSGELPTLEDGQSEDAFNIQRLKYLLWVEGQERSNALLLWRWVKVFETTHSYRSELRSLQLLLTLVPSSVILEVTGQSVNMLRDYHQQLLFVEQLEYVHLPCSPAIFKEYNKDSLVKMVLRKGAGPKFLELATGLSLHYNIFDFPLWERLLEELLKAHMLPLLRSALVKLSTSARQFSVPSLRSVAQQVLLAPFEDVCLPLSLNQQEECSKSLELLHQLGVSVSVPALVKAFFRVGMCVHGLQASLLVLCESERTDLVNNSLSELHNEELVAILDTITDGQCQSNELKDLVFSYLSAHQCHTWLLGSVHFSEYVQFLVKGKNIEGLLVKVLENHRVKEAVRLVELYTQHHSTTELHGMEALKEFLDLHNLWELIPSTIEMSVSQ